jgi:TetR/AcrR family transcriptional repressor of nem operon
MARPQEYKRPEALKSALNLFWSQGYTSTNLPQLLEQTGLSRSSFYAAFGDKRQLFIECLTAYMKSVEPQLNFVRDSDDPALAIYDYFSYAFNHNFDGRAKNGCLIVNTLIEFEDIDKELYQLAKNQIEKTDQAFVQCFKNAKMAGKLNSPLSAEDLTTTLATLSCGIQVRRRIGLRSRDIKTILNTFILSMGLQPPASSLVN